LPHLTLALVSLVPYGTWTTETVPPVLSLVNYRRVFSEPERLQPLLNSLWMATASTLAAVALALAAGALVGRRPAAASYRGAPRPAVGAAGHGVRDRARHDVQRAPAARPALGAGRHRGAPPARLPGA